MSDILSMMPGAADPAVKEAIKRRIVKEAIKRRVVKKAIVKKAVKRKVAKKAIAKKAIKRKVAKKASRRRRSSAGREEGHREEGDQAQGREEGRQAQGREEGDQAQGREEGHQAQGREEGDQAQGREEGRQAQGREEGRQAQDRKARGEKVSLPAPSVRPRYVADAKQATRCVACVLMGRRMPSAAPAPPLSGMRGRSRRRARACRFRQVCACPRCRTSPPTERKQNAAPFAPLCSERVDVTHRTLVVGGARDDSGLLEALQTLCEDVSRDALGRGATLAVRALAVEDVGYSANLSQPGDVVPAASRSMHCLPPP